jgi:stage II sporulation protein D
MTIATRLRRSPVADRSTRWLAAALLASAALLVLLVVPALAAETGAGGAGAAAAVPADASGSASPDPSASASPDPSASASPSPTDPPTATPNPWPTPSYPTTVTTLGSTVKFYGKGYGHGVGLNQYGARGRALAGQTAEQILAAYFKGAVSGTISPTRQVRVQLLAGYKATTTAPLAISGRGGAWAMSTSEDVFPADATLKAWRKTATVDGTQVTVWKARVIAPDGSTVLYAGKLSGTPVIRPVDAGAYLQLVSKPSTYDTYRGTLTLVLKTKSVSVVNTLEMDAYLRGAVPVEMPPTWPREALRAQAIASRSYAARRLHPDTGTFDLYDDTRSQVYRGIEAERASTDAVIAGDPGGIIRADGSIVNAFYFSTGGGATEDNEQVFVGSTGKLGSPVPYLRAVIDRSADGVPFDAAAPYYAWTTSPLTRAQLSAIFKGDSRTNVGDITQLDLRKRGPGGRLRAVVLIGSAGTRKVSADVFRSVYNAGRPSGTRPLRSNLFATWRLP